MKKKQDDLVLRQLHLLRPGLENPGEVPRRSVRACERSAQLAGLQNDVRGIFRHSFSCPMEKSRSSTFSLTCSKQANHGIYMYEFN